MEEVKMRKMIIAGNWKSNGTIQSTKDLVNGVLNKAEFDTEKVEVIVTPIYIHIASVKALLNDKIKVGSQNISQTGNGAFTGEISAEQLKDFDIQWVLIGHSERRTIFKETDDIVAAKVLKAQSLGLKAMICIGETDEEREAGKTFDVLKTQMEAFVKNVTDWSNVTLAYEPVWAIGTGKTATPEIAQECCHFMRNYIKENVSEEVANALRIQYGGSVNGKTAADLIAQPDLDGFLVGGASLKAEFNDIIAAANNLEQKTE